MWAKATEAGALAAENGKVEIRYKPNDGRKYAARAENLLVNDRTVLPDSTCGDAAAAAPKDKAEAKAAAPGARSTAAPLDGSVAVAYADGACSGNPGPAGLGVVFIDDGKVTEISEYLGTATNNIAELTAILRALEAAKGSPRTLVVHTDSQYAIGVLAKGWKPKANQELIAGIKRVLAERKGTRFVYVKGHAGIPLNERADELATSAVARRGSTRTERAAKTGSATS